MNEKLKKIIQYFAIIFILGVSLYYSLKGINFSDLWKYLVSANYYIILACIPIILMAHWIRAMRWKTMLLPIQKVKSTHNLFSSIMIGYMANSIVPRSGELLRPYVAGRREKIPYPTLLASVFVERFFFDVLTLLLFLSVSLYVFSAKIAVALPPGYDSGSLIKMLGFSALAVFVVIMLLAFTKIGEKSLKILVKPISENLYEKADKILKSFLEGFEILKHKSHYLSLIIQSLSIWICYILPIYICFFAFDFQSRLHLDISDGIIMLLISSISITLSPTPGAIGVYHLFMSSAMVRLYGISAEEAFAFATITHALNYLIQIVVGAIYIFREKITKIPKKEEMALS